MFAVPLGWLNIAVRQTTEVKHVAGLIGLMVTVLAMRSNSYRLLARNYEHSESLESQPKVWYPAIEVKDYD